MRPTLASRRDAARPGPGRTISPGQNILRQLSNDVNPPLSTNVQIPAGLGLGVEGAVPWVRRAWVAGDAATWENLYQGVFRKQQNAISSELDHG